MSTSPADRAPRAGRFRVGQRLTIPVSGDRLDDEAGKRKNRASAPQLIVLAGHSGCGIRSAVSRHSQWPLAANGRCRRGRPPRAGTAR